MWRRRRDRADEGSEDDSVILSVTEQRQGQPSVIRWVVSVDCYPKHSESSPLTPM